MDVNRMRQLVSGVYDSKKWADRVRKMSDNQVIAIYYRMLEEGKL